MTAANG